MLHTHAGGGRKLIDNGAQSTRMYLVLRYAFGTAIAIKKSGIGY